MAWHHHVLAAHHAVKHHARGFLSAAAARHPILVTVLALAGATTIVYEIAKPAAPASGPAPDSLKPVL